MQAQIKKLIILIIPIIIIAVSLVFIFTNDDKGHQNDDEKVAEISVIDVDTIKAPDDDIDLKTYVVSNEDLQLPELPTGCEATALSILLRMNGVEVTKTQVADAMPKGDDFVNQFWGDPYSKYGWACMAPCSVDTANMFLKGTGKAVGDYTGTSLTHLPLPCAIWVTIDMEEAIPSSYEKDGYTLMENPHCLVVTDVNDVFVTTIDPLKGEVEYPFSKIERVYKQLGSQAIYIN